MFDFMHSLKQHSTIGLVTLDEMRAKQDDVIKEREKKIAQKKAEKEQKRKEEIEAKNAQKQLQKQQIRALSFLTEEDCDDDDKGSGGGQSDGKEVEEMEDHQDDDEDDVTDEDELEEEIPTKKKKMGKNPDVDTSFLPDKDREAEENQLREQLRLVSLYTLI